MIYPTAVFWDAGGSMGSESVLAEWGHSSPAPDSAGGDLQHLQMGCPGRADDWKSWKALQ